MQNIIKKFILETLDEQKKDLLLEPDDSVDDDKDESCMTKEQSVVAGIGGVSTPLGTGSGSSSKSKSLAYKASKKAKKKS